MAMQLPFRIALPKIGEWFGPPKFLGIDIGTTSIKAVQLSREGGLVKLDTYGILENYGHLERANEAIQTSSLKIMDEYTGKMLRQLLDAVRPTTRKAVFSVPVFSSFVTTMELPRMTKKEHAEAIPFEARQYVPIPITEVALDWMDLEPLPGADPAKQHVLLVAVPQETLAKYYRIADLAGLSVRAVELETIALARALAPHDPTTLLIADIGARATNIGVVDGGYVRITRSIDVGGGDLTQVIASGLNVTPMVAEELKKTKGIAAAPGEESFAALLMPLLGVIVSEMQKMSRQYYEQSRREVKKVIVSGGSSAIAGLEAYIAREMEKEVARGDPFSTVAYSPLIEPILKELAPTFAVAVGLALRELLRY